MAVSLTNVAALAADAGSALGYIDILALPVVNDTITMNGTAFTWKASSGGATEITIGANVTAAATNAAAILNASAVSGVAAATYSSNAGRLLISYDTAGSAGTAYTLAKSSPNVAATAALVFSATPVANDTVTVAGVTFTYKASPTLSTEVATNVTAATAIANLATKIAAYTPAITSVTASANSLTLTLTATAAGTAGNGIAASWVCGSITINSAGTGTVSTANGADVTRITLGSSTLALGAGATAASGVTAALLSSDYEKTVGSLITICAALLAQGANPATSATTYEQALKQRRLLKTVLGWLNAEVAPVPNKTADDRATVSDRLLARVFTRFNNQRRDSGL